MTLILQPTPDVKRERIVVGTAIRKPPEIVSAYLESLRRQRVPPGCEVSYHFVLDTDDEVVKALVQGFVEEHGGYCEAVATEGPIDFDDNDPQTHKWTGTAMARVGSLKDRIIHRAKAEGAAAVWFCDADLLCDPNTLRSLWYTDAPIACAVYWTRWQNDQRMLAMPQVWLTMPYGLAGNGYPDEPTFRARLLTRQVTRVWGQGACTLLRRHALDKGVSFAYLPGVSTEGMMAGEDRHFCLRAEALHVPMVADPWPHIFHIYHPGDRQKITQWQERLAALHVERPSWLNLRLQMLEPVPTGPGQAIHTPPITARVRVGCGQLLPDLERQCLEHLDGEPFVASVLFPTHHPIAMLRGQKRLMEVVVVDHKDATGMPVLEEELVDGMDLATYTPAQQEVLHG